MGRDAPLLVVVGEHELVASGGPLAACHLRHRWVGSHAVRAFLVLLLSLAFIAGCGGSDSETTTESVATSPDECATVEAPEARDPATSEAPTEPLDTSKTHTLDVRDLVWIVHRHARSGARTEDDGVARRARRVRLLRRHDLPPGRPRLRHPGRRSDAIRRRRSWLLDGRRASVRRGVSAGHRRDGQVASRGTGHVGEPVLRRHRRRQRP